MAWQKRRGTTIKVTMIAARWRRQWWGKGGVMVLRLHRESADKGPSLTEPAATELPIAPVAPKLNTKWAPAALKELVKARRRGYQERRLDSHRYQSYFTCKRSFVDALFAEAGIIFSAMAWKWATFSISYYLTVCLFFSVLPYLSLSVSLLLTCLPLSLFRSLFVSVCMKTWIG